MRSRLRISVPDPSWLDEFDAFPDVELVVWDVDEEQPEGWIDLVLLPYGIVTEPLRSFDPSRIGVIQSQALGYDGVEDVLPRGSVYSNAVGVHEANTAELAVALTLASQRRLDEFARQQPEGRWDRPWGVGLAGRSVLVIGVGGIGDEIVRRLAGFDCEVIRLGRRRRNDERGTIHGPDELHELLPRVDVAIIAVPLTLATEHMVDDEFLDAMQDDSLVVNVSRGRITDTDAILGQKGRIRYATDVLDVEPVPASHPIRTAPGVFLTPHVGGRSRAQRPRVRAMVEHQIARLSSGDQPDNVVLRT